MVEVTLSTATDTTELLGCFEQSEPSRLRLAGLRATGALVAEATQALLLSGTAHTGRGSPTGAVAGDCLGVAAQLQGRWAELAPKVTLLRSKGLSIRAFLLTAQARAARTRPTLLPLSPAPAPAARTRPTLLPLYWSPHFPTPYHSLPHCSGSGCANAPPRCSGSPLPRLLVGVYAPRGEEPVCSGDHLVGDGLQVVDGLGVDDLQLRPCFVGEADVVAWPAGAHTCHPRPGRALRWRGRGSPRVTFGALTSVEYCPLRPPVPPG